MVKTEQFHAKVVAFISSTMKVAHIRGACPVKEADPFRGDSELLDYLVEMARIKTDSLFEVSNGIWCTISFKPKGIMTLESFHYRSDEDGKFLSVPLMVVNDHFEIEVMSSSIGTEHKAAS